MTPCPARRGQQRLASLVGIGRSAPSRLPAVPARFAVMVVKGLAKDVDLGKSD